MTDSLAPSTKTIDLVKTLYESLETRNIQKLKEIVTEDVSWNVTEGFPFTGIYTGLENVLHGFYAKLFEGLDTFYANKWKWIDAGNYVIVLGYYIIKVKNMTDENQIRFAHIWEIKNNKIAGVWQVADTAQLPSIYR